MNESEKKLKGKKVMVLLNDIKALILKISIKK
jgi:hypothetical protein